MSRVQDSPLHKESLTEMNLEERPELLDEFLDRIPTSLLTVLVNKGCAVSI